jgi:hypothetical protein
MAFYNPVRNSTPANQRMPNLTSQSSSTSQQVFSPEMKRLSDKYFGQATGAASDYGSQVAGTAARKESGIADNYAEQLALLQGIGDAQAARINRDFAARAGSVGSQLAGTGLYNTTVQGNMQQGVERNRQEAMGALQEQLAQQQLAALQSKGQQTSQAQSEEMSSQLALAQLLSGLYGQQGTYMPTLSESQSRSYGGGQIQYAPNYERLRLNI